MATRTTGQARRTRALAEMNARQCGPQVPGGHYLCGYWQAAYTVETMASALDGTVWLTVQWADGRRTVHCTAWDARADRVL